MKEETNRLYQENRQLQQQLQSNPNATQELSSLAPQVLSQVKKTIVRKLGGEATTTSSVVSTSFGQDSSLEESKNKGDGKYVSFNANIQFVNNV